MSNPTRVKKSPTTMVLPSPERPASPAIVKSLVGAVVGIEPM